MDNIIEKGLSWVEEATTKGYSFVKWDGSEPASECPICHNHSKDGGYYGGNCIWFASAYLYHGMGLTDIKCAGDGMLGTNRAYTKLLLYSDGQAQKMLDEKLGVGRFKLIRKSGRGPLGLSDLKRGDILLYYKSVLFWHTAVYMGDGRIIDSAIEPGGVTERDWSLGYPCRAALRYCGV